jgi:DNA-binding response OmpR family regulator
LAANKQQTLTILVVEDDHTLAELLRCALNDVSGWGATIVHDARSALDVLRHVRVNLLLLDVNLPDLSGPALIAHLRRQWRGPAPAVVMMSANDPKPEVVEAVSRGEVARFVSKPFDLDELIDTIEQVAARSPVSWNQPTAVAAGSVRRRYDAA